MNLENEILGTVATVMFDLLVAFFAFTLLKSASPAIVLVVMVVVLACVALFATIKVCKYWFSRIRNKGKQ